MASGNIQREIIQLSTKTPKVLNQNVKIISGDYSDYVILSIAFLTSDPVWMTAGYAHVEQYFCDNEGIYMKISASYAQNRDCIVILMKH